MLSTVTSKGQVTIPSEIRKNLGIQAGERLEFKESQGTITITRNQDTSPLSALKGLITENVDTDKFLAESRGR